jgi:hypothetical protein
VRKYNGDGTYTFVWRVKVTVPATAGGEAQRKALHLEDVLIKEAHRVGATANWVEK